MAYADTMTRARLANDDPTFRFAMTFGTEYRIGTRTTTPAEFAQSILNGTQVYDNHPRQKYAASEYGVCLPRNGSGWIVPGADSDHVTGVHYATVNMMSWFGGHVRDALAFNY